jgi:multidrug efflux pump subunit AcrA (membrane-fusion protein)
MFFTKLLRGLAGLLLAGLLVAACADSGDDGAGAGQGPATTTATTTPPTTVTAPAPPAGEVTVTGTVAAGVEGNCLLLQAQGGPYLLVGGDRAKLRPGALVAVTGRVDRALLSICQQGVPLVVASIEPVP